MTDAERQARYRAARAGGQPVIRFRRPADHRGRAKRWWATVDELVQLQAEYQAWLDALPQTLQETATAEALRAICDLDLQELQTYPPGEGRLPGLLMSVDLKGVRTSAVKDRGGLRDGDHHWG